MTQAAHLLRTVDDEIPSGVQRTLVELAQISIRQAAQQAVGGAKHDGNFPNEGLLVLCLQLLFTFLYNGLCDVNIQGGRVPERRQTGESEEGAGGSGVFTKSQQAGPT